MSTDAPTPTTMRPDADHSIRELDQRITDGIDVRLLWNSVTDGVSVAVEDQLTGEFFELPVVDPSDALIAFHHPYAYANRHRFDYAFAV